MTMKIAVPVVEGKLAMHFGHCEAFAVFEVDPEKKEISGVTNEVPPPHEPGVLPRWLADLEVNKIIAGGMGSRAQGLFSQFDIEVIVGASAEAAETVVKAYLDGTLESGTNVCDH